ncbi:beta-lactamase-like protein [Limtongia smithiae]|uniref:beta-lactamase-like protein n=1 Tax=Limtongia smithiae TaxID=1125753 RepID=UPI0034CEB91A
MSTSLDYALCATCATQFPSASQPIICPICEDPRQWVPASGQAWTTLRGLRDSAHRYRNVIEPNPHDPNMHFIRTLPSFSISQRAILLFSSDGKSAVLWDCIPFIDDATVRDIKQLLGDRALVAMVISHPHFYSTHVEWAEAFRCPVYLTTKDRPWVMRPAPTVQVFFDKDVLELAPGISVHRVGGHFDGSLVCAFESPTPSRNGKTALLVADSIAVALSGIGERVRLQGTVSFTFMYSYPNMVPLTPDAVLHIWNAVKNIDFDVVHGGWDGRDVWTNARAKMLESAKIFVRSMGYTQHAMLEE